MLPTILLPLYALPAAFHVRHRLRKVHPPDGIQSNSRKGAQRFPQGIASKQ
jgi:hypothetical protein